MALGPRRYPLETKEALEAKMVYLKLGEKRNFFRVATEVGHDRKTIKKWAGFFHWDSMAEAWDERNEEMILEEILAEGSRDRASCRKQLSDEGEFLIEKGHGVLDSREDEKIRPSEAISMMKLGFDLKSAERDDGDTRDGRLPTWTDFMAAEMKERKVRDEGQDNGNPEGDRSLSVSGKEHSKGNGETAQRARKASRKPTGKRNGGG